MKNFSSKDIKEYFYRNFTSVDGLWFVKIEEQYGFEKALEMDKEVWKVLPKIQARFIKSRLLAKSLPVSGNEPETLFIEAVRIKMKLDNYKFRLSGKPGMIKAAVTHCPWHEIMVRSNRQSLSEKVGSAICSAEYSVFASEFLKSFNLKISSRICNGDKNCIFEFSINEVYPV